MQVLAANGQSERVDVVKRDGALLERGREVRPLGVNLIVSDFFDAGEKPPQPQNFCLALTIPTSDSKVGPSPFRKRSSQTLATTA